MCNIVSSVKMAESDTPVKTGPPEDQDNSAKKSWYQYQVPADHPDEHLTHTNTRVVWQGFKQRSTAHGVPHIDQARGPIKKSFWILSTLLCVAVLITHLTNISMYFFDYRIDVVVKLVHKRELIFPAISICNMNPVRLSEVSAYPEIADIVYSNNSLPVAYDENGEPIRDEFRLEERLISAVADLTDGQKQGIGHQLETLMVDCQYAGSDCFQEEFIRFHDPLYGNCYTYNSGWKGDGSLVESSRRAGRRHGFKMVFNIEQDEYVEELVQSAGVRVVIHPQDRMPFPQDEGILATPGMLTSIGARQIFITRLGKPHGNCTDPKNKNSSRNVWEEYFPVHYSTSACAKTCYQQYLIKRCRCADPAFPMYGAAFDNATVLACEPNNAVEVACKQNVTLEYQHDLLECDCPVPCEETAYSFEISSVQWPSNVNKDLILDKYNDEIPELMNSSDPDAIPDNLLKVEIYFQEFNFETVEERPSYKPANYLSDIGGILGLWVGCSALSAFEFFELGIDLIVRCYFYFGRNKTKSIKLKNQKNSEKMQEARPKSAPKYDEAKYNSGKYDSANNNQNILQDHGDLPPGAVPVAAAASNTNRTVNGPTPVDITSTNRRTDSGKSIRSNSNKDPYFPNSPPPSYSSVYNLRSSSNRASQNSHNSRQQLHGGALQDPPDLELV